MVQWCRRGAVENMEAQIVCSDITTCGLHLIAPEFQPASSMGGSRLKMWSIWGASAEGLSLGPLLKHSHLGEEGEEDASSARQDCFLFENA